MIFSCGGEVEDVNNSRDTAPSKRLIKLFDTYDDAYDKVFYGEGIAKDIGIECMMEKCKRFSQWIEKIKSLEGKK